MSDPRLNLPSASAYAITEACAGSEELIRSMPPKTEEEEPDEQAERGNRIHAAWQTDDDSNLSEDERLDYQRSIATLDKAVTQWRSQFPADMEMKEYREERLWLLSPDTLEPVLSGQFDRLYVIGSHAFIADLKSGWCKTLTQSDQNRQLRVLSVLVWKEHGATTIQAAFFKPKIYRNQVDAVLYTENDLMQAEAQIFHTLWKSSQPGAERVPGSHCTYCPAKRLCPQAGAYSMLPSVIVQSIETKDMQVEVSRMSIEDRAAIQSRANVIRKILDEVQKSLKSETPESLARIGLQIGEGKKLDPITDTKGAFDALVANGINPEQLWQALKFSKGELTKAVMRDQGWMQKPSEGWIYDQAIKDFIEPKRSEGSLERIE